MNRTIYLGLIVLGVYLYNSFWGILSSNLLASHYAMPIAFSHNTAVNHANSVTELEIIYGRDEQTEECLRSGNCKD